MTRRLQINLAGPYFLNQYSRLLRDLRPLLELDEPTVVDVDMSRLTFMGPAALATTVAALTRALDEGLVSEGRMIQPAAAGMARYLHRMDFFRVLFHEPDLHDPSARQHRGGLLECQHFTDDSNIRPVTLSMLAAIEETTSLDRGAHLSLDTCLSEMLENVMFHAATPHGGMAAAQAFKNELELAIVDLGIGIPASLAKNPAHADLARRNDLTAVVTALIPSVTSTPERNKGWGLAFTELLLALNGGRMIVRSGAGHVVRGANDVEKLETERLPGTLVAMRIQIARPLDYSRAWELLDEAIGRLES